VILQGGEGGGHTGLVGTLPLVAQAVEAVKIPVIAAGGIYDGRGLAAALALGAQGVWMGTRFIASDEAHAANMYKNAVVGAGDTDTTRTRCYSGKPMRCRTNEYINDWETRPGDIQPFPYQAIHSTKTGVIGGIGGITDEAKLNQDTSCFAMGQSAGGVHEVKPVAAIVADIMRDAEAAIDRMASLKVKESV
jgi:enoyl-[acyl-carrier protein] reductase II